MRLFFCSYQAYCSSILGVPVSSPLAPSPPAPPAAPPARSFWLALTFPSLRRGSLPPPPPPSPLSLQRTTLRTFGVPSIPPSDTPTTLQSKTSGTRGSLLPPPPLSSSSSASTGLPTQRCLCRKCSDKPMAPTSFSLFFFFLGLVDLLSNAATKRAREWNEKAKENLKLSFLLLLPWLLLSLLPCFVFLGWAEKQKQKGIRSHANSVWEWILIFLLFE